MAEVVTTAPAPPGSVQAAAGNVSLSGLTEDEARAFHRMFVVSFLVFLGIAIVAHILVWQWRPWIPGAPGYEVQQTATASGR